MIEPLDPIDGVEDVPDGEAEQIREIARLMPFSWSSVTATANRFCAASTRRLMAVREHRSR